MKTIKLFFCAVLLASSVQAQRLPRRATPYLDTALEVSNYLASLEQPQASGIAWPASDQPGTYVSTGVVDGAAGIGFFYLRLYQVTRDPAFLDKARKAADFVDYQYRNGGIYGNYDWLSGVAGGGEFFLALYSATADPVYLNRATFAGDWLESNALSDAYGYHWVFPGLTNVYTSLAHGSGGVALFLTHLYRQTANPSYLQFAEGAVRWTTHYTVPLGDSAIGWKRLATDTGTYNGWCGGSAGMYFVLKELWLVTGNDSYLDLMLSTARGLPVAADWKCPGGGAYSASAGCQGGAPPQAAWGYGTPSYNDYPEIVCHGVASILFVLFDAFANTGDVTFRDTARAGIQWLEAVAEVQPQGLRWEHIYASGLLEPGLLTGTASIGYAFLRFSHMDPVDAPTSPHRPAAPLPAGSPYLKEAQAAAQYLLSVANHPQPNQSRWLTYSLPKPSWASDPAGFPVEYDTGWYTGAAGIGIFLLDLHDATCGIDAVSDELSPLNP
ncbi:MAG TPA: lanthionine synthetase LanC family protein [Bryobacteraceae bacterium]|nr:lanthionine synthetase LanC family protein [Bryobacteraceae bacterium]